MSTKRPTLARTVTPNDESERKSALDEGVAITIPTDEHPEGETFVLRAGDLTPDMAREVRRVTGRSFRRLVDDLSDDPDIDVIADAIWVAKRMRGDVASLDSVTVDYGLIASDGFDIKVAERSEEPGEGDLPEA